MHTLLRKKHFLLVLLSTLCLLAACGNSGQATQSAQLSPTAQHKTSHVSQTPGPTGSVVITTSKNQYSTSDSITVTVTNNLSTSIYASAYYTNCSPAQLQMKGGAVWTTLGSCPEATQSVLAIQPSSPKAFLLRPTGPMLSGVGSSRSWTPGEYRIYFNYILQPDPDTSQGGVGVFSGEFTISS